MYTATAWRYRMVPKLVSALVVSAFLTGCGVNLGGADGFPLEEFEPNAPPNWTIAALTGGDDWAEYTYQVGEDRMSVVICVAVGGDGLAHCESLGGPSETLGDLRRFPESESELNVGIVCAGPNPCNTESLQVLVADWNEPG